MGTFGWLDESMYGLLKMLFEQQIDIVHCAVCGVRWTALKSAATEHEPGNIVDVFFTWNWILAQHSSSLNFRMESPPVLPQFCKANGDFGESILNRWPKTKTRFERIPNVDFRENFHWKIVD